MKCAEEFPHRLHHLADTLALVSPMMKLMTTSRTTSSRTGLDKIVEKKGVGSSPSFSYYPPGSFTVASGAASLAKSNFTLSFAFDLSKKVCGR